MSNTPTEYSRGDIELADRPSEGTLNRRVTIAAAAIGCAGAALASFISGLFAVTVLLSDDPTPPASNDGTSNAACIVQFRELNELFDEDIDGLRKIADGVGGIPTIPNCDSPEQVADELLEP